MRELFALMVTRILSSCVFTTCIATKEVSRISQGSYEGTGTLWPNKHLSMRNAPGIRTLGQVNFDMM